MHDNTEDTGGDFNEEEEIVVQEELDWEALCFILRLYDGTFKDLADR